MIVDANGISASISIVTQEATKAFAQLAKLFAENRLIWLVTWGGEWPDKFVLLNRYMRTGCEPDYFDDDRWEA